MNPEGTNYRKSRDAKVRVLVLIKVCKINRTSHQRRRREKERGEEREVNLQKSVLMENEVFDSQRATSENST